MMGYDLEMKSGRGTMSQSVHNDILVVKHTTDPTQRKTRTMSLCGIFPKIPN